MTPPHAESTLSRDNNRIRDYSGRVRLYVGGISLTVLIAIASWLVTTGGYLKDIKNIPSMDKRLTVVETNQAVMNTKLEYIVDGIDELRDKKRRTNSNRGNK